MEGCNEVSCDNTRHRPVGSSSLSRVWENDPSLIGWKTGDRSPGDLVCCTLKEAREKFFLQRVPHGMEWLPYVRAEVLYKIPLLMERLLQSRRGGLQVIALHPSHDVHQILTPLYVLI